MLANYFLDRLANQLDTVPALACDAIDRLLEYSWPGNVRELEHLISAAAAMATGTEIHAVDLQLPFSERSADALDVSALLDLPLSEAKESFERAAITAALQKYAGNISAAARQLGIHRQSLQRKMAQLGIGRTS